MRRERYWFFFGKPRERYWCAIGAHNINVLMWLPWDKGISSAPN